MLALHYQITLPADYDMRIIRHRVETRGHALDEYPGLRFKAYLVREQGRDNSTVNEYAPFYVWHDEDAMGRFLWGGEGFAGIVGDFGRPSGQTWTVTHIEDGPAHHVAPRFATKLTASLEEHEDPQLAANENARWVEQQKVLVGVHTAIAGIDSRTWQTVRFTLWDARPVSQPGAEYQVLHLSEPTGV